ncbi:Fbox domain containing protein [Acanthamoeba castellanii str. Neff]|uniref:Fbox domain containing protein n=1 Tax=Acanthamoeba castellanii (strain ATCC 30010 / Neff) TaxID=1257118 RepID=L8GK42_ACACF|nr:Fbox domain containing protein [Acanthamoeba castellanii str. Neff]ELR13194.1 Fbox domain containing protein [Acanthamoeba castellanii str. Neff]
MEASEDEVERKLKTMEQAEEEQGEAPVPMEVGERRGSVVCGGVQMPTELWHQVFAHLDHVALCHTVSLVCWDWYHLANSNAPWRGAFQRMWRLPSNTPEGPGTPTWKARFKRVLNVETNWRNKRKKQTVLKLRCGKVMMVDFNDQYLTSASEDGTVRLWDLAVESGECKATKERILHGHHRWVNCVQLDGKWLASGADDMAIRLWNIANPVDSSAIEETALTRNGILASCSADRSVICWDVETNQPMQRLRGHLDGVLDQLSVRGLSLSDDGNVIVSGSYDKTLKVWDRRAGIAHRTLEFKGPVSCLHLSDSHVAVGTYAGEVHLYDFPSLRTVSISNRHGRVWCVQYDPVRDRLVSSMTWVRTDWPKSGTYAIEAPAAISTDGINSFKFNDHLLVSGGYAEVTMSNYDI